MNCQGSPFSTTSTGLNGTPQKKLKFSRKFVINLEEPPSEIKDPSKEKIHKIQQKILRYKRRYQDKKFKSKDVYKKNVDLLCNIDKSETQIQKLYTELEDEYKNYEVLMIDRNEADKSIDSIKDKINSRSLSINNGGIENRMSVSISILEDIQEQLFESNKKTSDMERLLSREQKKNEGFNKELRNLKIDLSSFKSK
ncbi:hypothetical protein SteCoe_2531 [Stentor coeruleus]|uniref:Uncharacterized protein n=1 Tax=Stentor coeruleus TaxID=5963 RepID=A0A1R2CZD2_9CILI|nr:hypothetical protein SteCoe_2531 [Stentor coeruleus]